MTDPIHEQLSAFYDDALAAAESELLLKRLQRDPQLRATVGRYSLIGEALRSTHSGAIQTGGPSREFAARVSKAIELETMPRSVWRPVASWLKPVAGGAIAAGVAAIALVVVRVAPPDASMTATSVSPATQPIVQPLVQMGNGAVQSASPASPLPSYTVPMNNVSRSAPPIQVINNGRLANFVMAHSEYSSPLGQRNVLTGLLIEDALPEASDNESLNLSRMNRPLNAEPATR